MLSIARLAAPLAIIAAGAFTTLPAHSAPTNAVVINEVETRGLGGGNDEFIELYNNAPVEVPIGGWSLRRCNSANTNETSPIALSAADGTPFADGRFPAGAVIPANGFLIIANTATGGYTGTFDYQYKIGVTDHTGVQLALPPLPVPDPTEPDETETFPVADRVGFSGDATTNKCVSGTAVQNTGSNDAYTVARTNAQGASCHALGTWTLAKQPTPGACNGLATNVVASQDVKLSEVDVSGTGTVGSTTQTPGNDEFVELANTSDSAVDLTGWTLWRCNSADKRLISEIAMSGSLGTIPAHGKVYVHHSLWTAPAGAPAAAATYSIGVSELTGVQLRDAELDLADAVGFAGTTSTNSCVEGNAAAAPLANSDLSAHRTGVLVISDTNDNARDFSVAAETPGA